MKNWKKLLALLLALALCLSLCACGGKDEEANGEIGIAETDEELEALIFAEEAMKDVEHYGLAVNADTASFEQMVLATAMMNYQGHTPVEGTEHLYNSRAYACITLADGNWYYPVSFVMPSDARGDNLQVNDIDYISADCGRLSFHTEFITMLYDEEWIASRKQEEGWENFTDAQIYLVAALETYLDIFGMTLDDETQTSWIGNESDGSDETVFNQSFRQTEDGEVMALTNLHVIERGADGAYVIAVTIIDGVPVVDGEYDMTKEEEAVFDEFMNYTGFYNWLE